ncbi:unnamed protein product [Gulo gulo]|uniref:Uncharacterized protein n=1 Tax=Gulo gulo TaxID=48420 RepID=A0A9X9LGW6_GULGU|nr:unnamed protein product [Gulo gulo]
MEKEAGFECGPGGLSWRTDCSLGEEGRQLGYRPEEERKASHAHVSLHIQEIKVPKHPKLLLAVRVIHVLLLAGAVLRRHQARLVLQQVQIPARRKNHLRITSVLS